MISELLISYFSTYTELGDTTTHEEERLSTCVEEAQKGKEKALDLLNSKVKDVKRLLAPGVEVSHAELADLMNEI